MMEENKYLIQTIIDLLKEIYEQGVNKYLNEGLPSVKILKFDVSYPKSNNVVDFINSKGTYEATVRMNYVTINEGKESKKDPIELRIPILLDGIYVVDGKTKLPLNHIVNDPQIAVYKNKIIIDSDRYISKVNGLKFLDSETGAFIKYDWKGPKQDDILKLDDYASKKLGILFHLDENPTELTEDAVSHIQAALTGSIRDNVLNKRIMDAPGALIRCLKVNKAIILHKIRNKYYQSMRYKTESNKAKLYARDIQIVIDKFFRGNDQYFHGIQNPTNVNPLIFQSMRNKVIFENDSSKTSKYIPYAKYDTSFYGIVDPILTPDNTNTSRVNELTRCVSIRDGETWIKCLDKQFNVIELKYIDYVNSKILMSKHIDYDFNEVEQLSEYDVKYRFEDIKSPFYDYMEMSPDWRLSLATAQVPMLNLDDSIRVAMGSKMCTQAIRVQGSQRPRVATGNGELADNPLVTKYNKGSGVITEIAEGIAKITQNDGTESEIKLPMPIKGNNGINIAFDFIPKVGDTIKNGDPIIKPKSLDDNYNLMLGVNTRVAMMTYRGYNYEDGVIVSESYADKMSHITVQDVTIEILPNVIIEGMAEVGDRLHLRSLLMTGKLAKVREGMSKSFLEDLGLNKKYASPWNQYVPNDIDDAIVYDIRVEKGSQVATEEADYFMSGVGRAVSYDNKQALNETDWDLEDVNLQMIPKFKASSKSAYTVKYRLIVKNKLKLGDKLTNRFGSKGVVSLILPDTEMPYDSDGIPVDCIMNPHAVISRKNLSQSCEILLTKIADKIFFLNDMLLNDENFDEIRSNLKKYRLFQYFKMTEDEIKEYHENNSTYNYITGAFSKINVPTVMEWMKELGIEEGIDLWDGKTRKRIRNKILVGDMYMMKLYFLSNAYSKVTETKVPGLNTLVLGQGSITRSGSKFGNMEMDALQANNIMEVVEDQKFDDVYSAGWFLAHSVLTGLIFKLKDKDEDAD